SSGVAQDQLLESAAAIAGHFRKPLLGDRKNPSRGLSRIPVIEDAELQPGNILLNDRVAFGGVKVSFHLAAAANHGYSGSALAYVRLQHDREVEVVAFQELRRFPRPGAAPER